MCNMDKCNQINEQYEQIMNEQGQNVIVAENKSGLKSNLSLEHSLENLAKINISYIDFKSESSNTLPIKLQSYLKKHYSLEVVKYITRENGNIHVLDLTRSTLIRTNASSLKILKSQIDYDYKHVTVNKELLVVKTPSLYKKEGFIDIFAGLKLAISAMGTLPRIEQAMKNLASDAHFKPWAADLFALLVDLTNLKNFNLKSLLSALARLYSLITRFQIFKTNLVDPCFQAESFMFTSLSEVATALAVIGVPTSVVNMIKNYTMITGKKIQDSMLFMESFSFLISVIKGILEWLDSFKIVPLDWLVKAVDGIFDFVNHYNLLKKIAELQSQFVKNPQVMIDVVYRNEVLKIAEKAKSPSFAEYYNNDNNRYAQSLVRSFLVNIVRYAETYTLSSKAEPICIVFCGGAGTGKSVLMNNVVQLLKKMDRSVHVHTTPCVDAGKDFYDDYCNEEIFVMDDLGQQGNSQWRQIINFVSPVKFPLDCAVAEKKNTKFFNSKVILCTTNKFKNMNLTTTDCISEPKALYRRVHLVNVSNDNGKRKLMYEKYDHELTNTWQNKFIGEWKDFSIQPNIEYNADWEGDNNVDSALLWILQLITDLEQRQEDIATTVTLDEDRVDDIIANIKRVKPRTLGKSCCEAGKPCGKPQFKKESASFSVSDEEVNLIYDEVSINSMWNHIVNGVQIVGEFFKNLLTRIKDMVTSSWNLLPSLTNMDKGLKYSLLAGAMAIMAVSLSTLALKYASDIDVEVTTIEDSIVNWKALVTTSLDGSDIRYVWWNARTKEWRDRHGYVFQSGSMHEDATQKQFRFVEIRSMFGSQEVVDYCQALVSGKRIVLPHHAVGKKPVLKVYKNWEAFERKEIELDGISVKEIERISELDMVVCEFLNLNVPIYKLARSAFINNDNIKTANMNFMNCYHNLPLHALGAYNYNAKTISVRHHGGMKDFLPGSGIHYMISSAGLCGSMLYAQEGGIVGMHVAGNGIQGFSILFSPQHRERLRDLLLNTQESMYDLHQKDNDLFSGVRLRYKDGEIEQSRALGKSSFIPTPVHVMNSEAMKTLVDKYDVKAKAPPNFLAGGTPKASLKKIAYKSFKPVGKIDRDALEYAKKVVKSFLVEFKEVPLKEAIFGNVDLNSLKMDSSNGYGWDLKKEDLFDKKTGFIHDDFIDRMDILERQAKEGKVDISHLLCRESFKDELRKAEKVDKPRTFRVMPLQHIVTTKMLLGNLLVHVRKNMWTNGIAIGINPYKDWDRLYKLMKEQAVLFDIDFGEWDGSLNPQLQDALTDIIMELYKGEKPELLKVILDSIIRTAVLIADELMLTTHSMPSGTWVTALFNSLYNKMISAMAFYVAYKEDKGKEPTVKEFRKLLDWAMGDDKLCGAPKEYAHLFNALTVKKVAEDLGMTCTTGGKNEIVVGDVPLEDITFLKRHFRWHTELKKFVGPLSLDTLFNTVQWYDSKKDFDVVMSGKAISVQTEAYLHHPRLRDDLYDIMKEEVPHIRYMDDDAIKTIMDDDNGYKELMIALDKDYLY